MGTGAFADSFDRGMSLSAHLMDVYRQANAAAYDSQLLEMKLKESMINQQSAELQNQMMAMKMSEFADNAPIRREQAQLGLQQDRQQLTNMQDQHANNQFNMQQAQYDAQQKPLQNMMQMASVTQSMATNKAQMERALQETAQNQFTFERQKQTEKEREALAKAAQPQMRIHLAEALGMKPEAVDFNVGPASLEWAQGIQQQKQSILNQQSNNYYKAGMIDNKAADTQFRQDANNQRNAINILEKMTGPRGQGLRSQIMNVTPDNPDYQLFAPYKETAAAVERMKGQLPEGATMTQIMAHSLGVMANKDAKMNDKLDAARIMLIAQDATGNIKAGDIPGQEVIPGMPGPQVKETPEQAKARTLKGLQNLIQNLSKADPTEFPAAQPQDQAPTQQTQPQGQSKSYTRSSIVDAVKSGEVTPGMKVMVEGKEVTVDQAAVKKIKGG